MLLSIYIEALLVNEESADQVWEAWTAGELCDLVAASAWLAMIVGTSLSNTPRLNSESLDVAAKS